jgi:predicted DNA-binding transcriptional regulator YafY
MRSGFDLPPLMFTRDELTALTLGARFVKAWSGAELALAAEEALVKIESILPEQGKRVIGQTPFFAMAFEMADATRGVIDRLDAAIREQKRLHIAYNSLDEESTERDIRPLGLYHWGKTWTLAAWCELRKDFRNFRADRIGGLAECGDRFRQEPGKTLKDFLRRMAEECRT